MITIVQVARTMGQVTLNIDYSTENGNASIQLDAQQIIDRLKELKKLVGRKPTLSDVQEIVITLINAVREDKQPLIDIIPWENYIGIDLEA